MQIHAHVHTENNSSRSLSLFPHSPSLSINVDLPGNRIPSDWLWICLGTLSWLLIDERWLLPLWVVPRSGLYKKVAEQAVNSEPWEFVLQARLGFSQG